MNAPVHYSPASDVGSIPLETLDPSHPRIYQDDVWHPYFERLRREDPVHFVESDLYGPFWSVTKYKDIMQCETSHATLSSAAHLGGIAIRDPEPEFRRPSFISMDPPKH
ncbi:MAG: hypothetical protein J2P47_09740, partial [Acetobacteraceae bacterium]|nr:hypothetical protein [Acetobacteraceae bacterium]